MRLAPLCLLILFASPVTAEDIFEPGEAEGRIGGGVGGEGPAWHPELGVLTSGGENIHTGPRGKSRIYRKGAGTNGLLFDR